MMYFAKKNLVFGTILIILYITAWFIQSHFLINWDVSWDILITQRLLTGGTYTNDFFDLNPPLILFLYLPSVMLAKFFLISNSVALRIYIFLLSSLSLYMCSISLKSIFAKERYLASLFLIALAIIFLILPLVDFGEREHFLIILTMPYFFAIYNRLEDKAVGTYFAIGTGFLAGIGFAIKPYFLLTPALIELYYMYHTRQLFGWVRIETITILFIIIAYIFYIFNFHPDYISTIAPLSMLFYYDGFSDFWSDVIFDPTVFFCTLAVLISFTQYKKNPYKNLISLFVIATIGFLCSYFAQRTSWPYHSFPAYSSAILLYLLLLFYLLKHSVSSIIPFSFAILLTSLILLYPIYNFNQIYLSGISHKKINEPLISFLKTNASHKSVYFFSASPREFFSAIDESHTKYASRFLHLLWIPGIVKQTMLLKNNQLSPQQIHAETTLNNMVCADLETKKPDFIFVDVKTYKNFFQDLKFNYLNYFLNEPKFPALWKNYRYLSNITSRYGKKTIRWDLYLAPNKDMLNPNKITHNAIVLTGEGNPRIAYFVANNHILKGEHSIPTQKVYLSEQELKFILTQNKVGEIAVTPTNYAVVNQIIAKADIFPAYSFDVFERKL